MLSAKLNLVDELIAEKMSLMYTKKSSGPNMLPCGTPDNTGKHQDRQLLIDTHRVLLERYDLNHFQ